MQWLGQGGFGRTVLAWDEGQTPPQRCVIKQLFRSQGDRDRDLAEAERLAQLGQHPQIPDLIAILDSPRDLCLVQTYVPGRTLEAVLAADGPFTEVQVRSLLTFLLPVLQFIHDQGIIHRDIKPENILLPGGDRPPVLVDFGAARTAPTASELARTGTVIGSAGYAAPEQALGKAVPASDLYSLGMTCLHLLTGQHPFDLYSVVEDRWIWEALVMHPVSPTLTRILNRLTARSLRSRYPSAEAALADLAPAGILAPVPVAGALTVTPGPTWHGTRTWPTPGRVVNAIAVSPDGRAIATANRDGTVQLWDEQTGDLLHTFAQRLGLGNGHRDQVTAVQFHRDGRHLFSGSQDGTVKVWDLRTYQLRQTLRSDGWPLTAIALAPNGTTLITAATNGTLTLWRWPAGEPYLALVRHAGAVSAIALSPDGTRLASVDTVGTARLWALPAGSLIHTWTLPQGLSAIALSVAPPALVTGDVKGRVMACSLLDLGTQEPLESYQDAVSAIALSPNGQTLAIGSRDRDIHLWDWRIQPPQRLAVLRHDWAVQHLVFSPDSQTLISSAADETLRFWQPLTDSTPSP